MHNIIIVCFCLISYPKLISNLMNILFQFLFKELNRDITYNSRWREGKGKGLHLYQLLVSHSSVISLEI